jgi:hypothetical protein
MMSVTQKRNMNSLTFLYLWPVTFDYLHDPCGMQICDSVTSCLLSLCLYVCPQTETQMSHKQEGRWLIL